MSVTRASAIERAVSLWMLNVFEIFSYTRFEPRYSSARTCCVASNALVSVALHATRGVWLVAKFNVDSMRMLLSASLVRSGVLNWIVVN